MPIEADTVLSFSAPVRVSARVQAAPSAAFELLHVLSRMGLPKSKTKHMGWVHELQNRREELAQSVREFWSHEASTQPIGLELFLLAAQGHAKSLEAQAFIDELPQLIERAATLKDFDCKDEGDREMMNLVASRISALREPARLSSYQELLTELWQEMRPRWEGEGVNRVRAECERMNRELEAGADILAVLPAKHFVRFEAFKERLRRFQEEGGNAFLTPLFFIGGGGHAFDFDGQVFVGFGLESDSSPRHKERHAAELAGRLKALADPTRLMILALVCDFAATLTVSDIATLFGTTQPTVSGHLKLLKEAGLVSLAKKGNKSFYGADTSAVEELLGELKDFVTPLRSQ